MLEEHAIIVKLSKAVVANYLRKDLSFLAASGIGIEFIFELSSAAMAY